MSCNIIIIIIITTWMVFRKLRGSRESSNGCSNGAGALEGSGSEMPELFYMKGRVLMNQMPEAQSPAPGQPPDCYLLARRRMADSNPPDPH
eukprot:1152183-Pelagomonas_calceolata.AAC.5